MLWGYLPPYPVIEKIYLRRVVSATTRATVRFGSVIPATTEC